jgi:hypothetical protein
MRHLRFRLAAGLLVGLAFAVVLLIVPAVAPAVPLHFGSPSGLEPPFAFEAGSLIDLTVEGQALSFCGPGSPVKSICAFLRFTPFPQPASTPFHAEYKFDDGTVFFTHDQAIPATTPSNAPGLALTLIAPFPPDCCDTLRSFTMTFTLPADERIFHGTAFEPTPEPSTLLLVSATTAGLGLLARRRAKTGP